MADFAADCTPLSECFTRCSNFVTGERIRMRLLWFHRLRARLQYVDFTIGYEKGFANLVKELNRDGKTELLQPVIADKPSKNFFRKPVFFVLLTAMVIAIAAGYKFYFNNDKNSLA